MRESGVPLRLGPVVIEIGRCVYGTVILMTVLEVYAKAGPVNFEESIGVVIAPMLATFLAHLFASILAAANSETRGLSRHTIAEVVRTEAQFLMLIVPPT